MVRTQPSAVTATPPRYPVTIRPVPQDPRRPPRSPPSSKIRPVPHDPRNFPNVAARGARPHATIGKLRGSWGFTPGGRAGLIRRVATIGAVVALRKGEPRG